MLDTLLYYALPWTTQICLRCNRRFSFVPANITSHLKHHSLISTDVKIWEGKIVHYYCLGSAGLFPYTGQHPVNRLTCVVCFLQVPNIAKKIDAFKKDVEAKKKPPEWTMQDHVASKNRWTWKRNYLFLSCCVRSMHSVMHSVYSSFFSNLFENIICAWNSNLLLAPVLNIYCGLFL